MAKRKWISGAVKEGKGALHRHLHVPEGEKIPEEKLESAMHSKNKTIRREAQLARTLKGFHPKAKKKGGAELLYGAKR
jgi:ribosomal protein L16/L10AE